MFPCVVSKDIRLLKDFGKSQGMGSITWHGFRRGRTVDLLERGGANGVCMSLGEIYESGGWKFGSRALLSYIPHADVHKERVFKLVAEASDTEMEN